MMMTIIMDVFPYAGIEIKSLITLVAFPIILLLLAMNVNR